MQNNSSVDQNFEMTEHFENAFDLLENTRSHVFITGKAGTGKSTLLEYFRDHSKKNIAVLAPTGVAAVNVKGQTIHSFFRFKPDITPDTVESIRMYKSKREIYKKLDAVVIDEVSMVRADLLDCIDEFLRRFGPEPELAFGGVQMIFFGDLYQLPPVVTYREKEIFQSVYQSPFFFDAKVYKRLAIEYMEFDRIFRQTQEEFIQLLGSIRNNSINAEQMKHLNSRLDPAFEPDDDFFVYLTTTNAMAEKINQRQLDALKTRSYHFEGELSGDFKEQNLPTQEYLDLKFGAQVMLLNNDSQGRWINGSIGKVVGVTEDEQTMGVVHVELDNGKRVDVSPFTWEMFRYFFNEETEMLESESVGSFTQFPLKLAWAVTIHKSQGKTFSKVILDIGDGTFASGQLYVALSRCTTFEGLILRRPVKRQHILMDWRVVKFMNHVKTKTLDEISCNVEM